MTCAGLVWEKWTKRNLAETCHDLNHKHSPGWPQSKIYILTGWFYSTASQLVQERKGSCMPLFKLKMNTCGLWKLPVLWTYLLFQTNGAMNELQDGQSTEDPCVCMISKFFTCCCSCSGQGTKNGQKSSDKETWFWILTQLLVALVSWSLCNFRLWVNKKTTQGLQAEQKRIGICSENKSCDTPSVHSATCHLLPFVCHMSAPPDQDMMDVQQLFSFVDVMHSHSRQCWCGNANCAFSKLTQWDKTFFGTIEEGLETQLDQFHRVDAELQTQ